VVAVQVGVEDVGQREPGLREIVEDGLGVAARVHDNGLAIVRRREAVGRQRAKGKDANIHGCLL